MTEQTISTMNVLLIDDHPLFREGLQLLLSDLSETLTFSGCSGIRDVEQSTLKDADLILLDLHTSDSQGIDSLKSIREDSPAGAIVIVSSEDSPHIIKSCIDNGAMGFIPKKSKPPILIAALKLVLAGGVYIPPESVDVNKYDSQMEAGINLTKRQMQALLHVAKGLSNKSIAREMNISDGTVKLHLSEAYKALKVSSRTEAVYELSQLQLPELTGNSDVVLYPLKSNIR